ncbi:head GIN domain-containing protein [Ancylomarina longa]|uniref:DUF2807 domain-containing protein n=1 Tax=Ancylomarina longa TaxID=2487017 RepID=A0A434AGI4_9BACT|nr:head GIN domain-containing protein [Ancylomarina longa]RUT73505.1 DUF2807 domain-containing protein [Ancylomarina longa]
MNTKRITSLLSIFAFVLSSSLIFAQKTENRNVGSFESISLSIHAKVYLNQGNSTSLKIKGNADDLEKILTETDGSTLKIKRKKASWGWNKSFKRIEVYITTPTVRNLTISGSGNIITQTPIHTDDAEYVISGSGKLIVDDLHAKSVNCTISGSGDINLKGNGVEDVEINISGSGNVNAANLEAENVSIRVSGSGDCKVFASKSLNAKVAGSGDIYYRGKPEKLETKSLGSGSIKSVGM